MTDSSGGPGPSQTGSEGRWGKTQDEGGAPIRFALHVEASPHPGGQPAGDAQADADAPDLAGQGVLDLLEGKTLPAVAALEGAGGPQ